MCLHPIKDDRKTNPKIEDGEILRITSQMTQLMSLVVAVALLCAFGEAKLGDPQVGTFKAKILVYDQSGSSCAVRTGHRTQH